MEKLLMPVTIFHTESGNTEAWLEVCDDGRVWHHRENSGWTMARRGQEPKDHYYTPEEAKERWARYADKIDAALAQLSGSSSN